MPLVLNYVARAKSVHQNFSRYRRAANGANNTAQDLSQRRKGAKSASRLCEKRRRVPRQAPTSTFSFSPGFASLPVTSAVAISTA